MKNAYLGDGAYVEFDGYAVVLTTDDGVHVTNRIVLEPQLLGAFLGWLNTHFPEFARKMTAVSE